ncbi:hypothetical protein XA68_17491 [Ophiocordyceps unilateralis]|uniref:Extracellular membrane protein CFEM domain-containing protein n=1 Tax=Ophiocordyceps unilateralis TaxID=268505 RepID=A0A2A9PJ23_OPHUN|nr:hypothetical protein XA68_17491 [Ophiocordyceps unilateralis]
MKFTIVALALAGVASAASADGSNMQAPAQTEAEALDIGKLLGGLKPLLKKAKCVMPCISKNADALDCGEDGPVSTFCKNVDKLVQDSDSCIKQCGIDKSTAATVTKVIKDVCQQNVKA